ncbi:hypothetical protein EJ05DRAFT_533119 [Pseudovirgaria hyperparasitica]|uniref:SH3 domain-containing protein n=1 Tax=Pseudovirgaria hyperparasitica TaxID=470096 RepID=A0A6A6VYV3_9PEZI|nr:uncharacterized protein EJ05DRAFT_533119 [Pseudovirgaria hyperparasitica]KAF2754924.1 hypothetical protein EJ05DRAFT_533119 [Pseudovirgaria hyperparasitica]
MAPPAPGLPTKFPCWCKAVYSWGGETKRDLGFIEGDMIECLNAGDGSWWMGRLKRDKRMVGLFPSNFVQVLENYDPVNRSPSPLPPMQSPAGSLTKPSPQKSKSVFRKPFQAYHAASQPNPEAAARKISRDSGGSPNLTPTGSINTHRPYSAMKRISNEGRNISPSPLAHSNSNNSTRSPANLAYRGSRTRAHSPTPLRNNSYSRVSSPAPLVQHLNYSRGPSPAPPVEHFDYSRGPSPAPPSQYIAYSRGPSPAPQSQYQAYSRGPSPAPYNSREDIEASPPPPPPPPHRVLNTTSRAPSPMHPEHNASTNGYHTPEPPSPRPTNMTPSPLTNAMNDVMASLDGMEMPRETTSRDSAKPAPGIWSPEAFEDLHTTRPQKFRAQTSLGIGEREDEEIEGRYVNNDFQGDGNVSSYVRRMESRLRRMQAEEAQSEASGTQCTENDKPPKPPPKGGAYARPVSPMERENSSGLARSLSKRLRHRKSAVEIGKEVLGRTFTTKSSSTEASKSTQNSSSTQMTGQSIMSAGGFSATSAGSLARRKWATGRPMSVMETRSGATFDDGRPETPFTGITYHSSHASGNQDQWQTNVQGSGSPFGGLTTPKQKRSGFFKRMVESAKTGAANARSTIAVGSSSRPQSRSQSRSQSRLGKSMSILGGLEGISGSIPSGMSSPARDMGLGGASDWVQVRRDVNRSNSLSKNERQERAERCQMMDVPVINPVDILLENAEGDEGLDGLPVSDPIDFSGVNFSLVDKSVRFIKSLPPMTNPGSLAQGHVCRPYRSDVQRLRAIFTWVSERIGWEEDFVGDIDSRRVIQSRRACAEESAVLVMEMCSAVGLHAEVVNGYLKTPGEELDMTAAMRPNHWWNAVIVDGQWRIMDCCLANPSNPKRHLYSSASTQVAETFWFLARPIEICYTHIPIIPEQQHICPPLSHEVLLALPAACPPYFKNSLQIFDFDTSLLSLDNLELAHIHCFVPQDVEFVAEVEAGAYSQDNDGDYFENGNTVKKRALAQSDWVGGQKRYTIKALLPSDAGQGVLKVYAGKRGLMHSIKSNPHSLAFALPLTHVGQNPAFEFVTIHPTPHAQRHDLYVAQPQCARLALNNTFVFQVRQHPSAPYAGAEVIQATSHSRAASPNPFARPTSALSMTSASTSQYSHPSNSSGSSSGNAVPGQQKPAKLAIQSPTGKIIRFIRKGEHMVSSHESGDGSVWETVIKIGEKGTWRGLVLADRSARWCVFAEWESG